MSKAEDLAKELFPLLETYEIGNNPYITYNTEQLAKQEGFVKGYQQVEKDLLDNIWHNPDEEPEIDRKIIWESENFLGKHLDREWKPRIDCFGRKERWCYLADILPSKNWTGERPYSKVDYSRGYDNGYEQAEKDLELTWEDIRKIVNIYEIVLNDKDFNTLPIKDGYTEVLKRFKESKGE